VWNGFEPSTSFSRRSSRTSTRHPYPPPPPRAPQSAAGRHGPSAGLAARARRGAGGDLADLVRDDRAVLFLCELQLPRRLLHARPRRLQERNVHPMMTIRKRKK